MKKKLLIPLSVLTIAGGGLIPLITINGCSTSNEITIKFTCGTGGTLTGDTAIKVNKDTKWKDIKKPEYHADENHQFYGWTVNDMIIKDEDIISSNLDVVCKFEEVAKIGWYTCEFNEQDKTVCISNIEPTPDVEEINIPSRLTKEGVEYTVTELYPRVLGMYCDFVRRLTIPYTVTNLRNDRLMFDTAFRVESLKVDPNNPVFTSRDSQGNECNCIVEKSTKKLLCGVGNVIIPDIAETIAANAFNTCRTIRDIVIPNNIKYIEEYAFQNSSIQKVTISGSVKTIGEWAFCQCPLLRIVTIEEGVETIQGNAFAKCKNLYKVSLPKGLVKIGFKSFAECDNLSVINFPEGLKIIDENAFFDSEQITSIILPDSLEEIGPHAFEHTLTQEIHIGPNVKKIGYVDAKCSCSNPFGRTSLKKVTVDSRNQYFSSRDENGNECNAVWQKNSTDGDKLVFASYYKSWIPNNIKVIGKWAFAKREWGKDYINPTGGDLLTIPDSVVTIENEAFKGADIRRMKIGKNVVFTKDTSEAFYYIGERSDIEVDPANTTISSQDVNGMECHCIMDKNRSTIIVATNHTQMIIPSSVTTIGLHSYYALTGVHEVPHFDSNVTKIDNYAFANNHNLQIIDIAPSITSIGIGAFGDLQKISQVSCRKVINSEAEWPADFNNLAFYGSTFEAKGTFYVANQEAIEIIRNKWPEFAAWTFKVIK